MFGALRDCTPQLKLAKHEENNDVLAKHFRENVTEIFKQVGEWAIPFSMYTHFPFWSQDFHERVGPTMLCGFIQVK